MDVRKVEVESLSTFLPRQTGTTPRKMISNDSMWCNQGSPRAELDDDDILECKRKLLDRREHLLERLPLARELRSPVEEPHDMIPQTHLVSISELDPFFEDVDLSSSASSVDGDVLDEPNGKRNLLVVENGTEREESSRSLITWSKLAPTNLPGLPSATKSPQDSLSSSGTDSSKYKSDGPKVKLGKSGSSSSEGRRGGDASSIRSKLRRVSHRVKKHLSATGGFIVEKLTRVSADKSNSSLEVQSGESNTTDSPSDQPSQENIRVPEEKSQAKLAHPNQRRIGKNSRFFMNDELILWSKPRRLRQNPAEVARGIVLNLPNWVENVVTSDKSTSQLEDLIEDVKRSIAQKRPMEWAQAVDYLRRSIGRDFRRGYLALGEKMQLANSPNIRCLKFNPFHSFLAIGCEEGNLILLELDYEPLHNRGTRSKDSLQDLVYHNVAGGSTCRIQMNETLVGHRYDLRCIAWNYANGKLVTSDEIGVIIGWAFGEHDHNCWIEEMVNDKSTSRIRDIATSPDGKRIVVGYEDYSGAGSVTGGVLVAYADGTHIYDRKFPESQIQFVAWHSETTVWAIVNYTLYTLNDKGEFGKLYRSIAINGGQSTEITSFLLKPRTSWVVSESAPSFIVVYKDSCMSLYNSIDDKAPVRVYTQVAATCADWSGNGLYVVVGGLSGVLGNRSPCPQINLYNYEGKLLQILKIPENTMTGISWDPDSLHLSVATGRQIYFASLRPLYKVASNLKGVHCYAYTKDCVTPLVGFWNDKMFFTEKIPGKVIDIKCFEDKFAILGMDNLGVYHVFVHGETGVNEQHLPILTMEPFALTMTKSSIICLAPNAILNWNYNVDSGCPGKLTGTLKKTRQVHVDDFPGLIAKPGERGDHLLRPALDNARCLHALRDKLCVARESGKLQLYSLPTLGILQTYPMDFDGDICQQICFNEDGTQLAILSMNGRLRICIFPQNTDQLLEIFHCDNVANISSFIWAVDAPEYLCVLEGKNLRILCYGQIVETIARIPSGCYFANYEGLYITMINMDRVIENPECPSATDMVFKLPTPTLTRFQDAIENDEELLEDIVNALTTSYSHTVLKNLIASEALRQGECELAESIYHDDKNYEAIQFFQKLADVDNLELKSAQIHCFLKEYEHAQHYFLRAGRKDLAIKMWKDLGDWDKVNFLTGYTAEDIADEALESQYDMRSCSQDWENAFEISNKLGSAEKLMECCIMMEDYEKLVLLSEKLPANDPLLYKIGEILAANGMIEEAGQCMEYGSPVKAMKMAIDTQHWDLAMKLSHDHNLPLISPALVKHVKSLIATNRLSPAIQILERCGKIITAGKLLVWKALRMLEMEFADTMEVKKTLVLAARMLSTKRNRGKSNINISKDSKNEVEDLDLEYLIPKADLSIMCGHSEWCWSDPWRGAEAVHFLNLVQRFLYSGMLGRAFKAAVHLKNFEDIVGSERITTLLTLTAIKNNYFKVASNALVKLEAVDESFASVSFSLFKDHAPKDHDVTRVACNVCSKYIADFDSVCPFCNTQFAICIFSASRIKDETTMWTCKTCCRNVEASKTDRFEHCPLCHSTKQ